MKNKAKKIINFSELSRLLTGNRTQIMSSYSGKLYKGKLDRLIEYIEKWMEENRI